MFCTHCGRSVEMPLPVEPLYSLATAALLAPATVAAVKGWMQKHKDQCSAPIYRLQRSHGNRGLMTRRRMVTASDLVALRAAFTSPHRIKPKEPVQDAPQASAVSQPQYGS